MSQNIQGHVGVSQLDGNVIDRNAGVSGEGTQRVVMASDSPVVTAATAQGVGATSFTKISTGTTQDKTNLKASAGVLKSLNASNVNAAACYVKIYNKAGVPDVSTDTPIATLLVPGATTGGVNSLPIPPEGIACSLGIGYVIVTTVGITGNTGVAANEVVVNGSYK
jgi:hypothetical protein